MTSQALYRDAATLMEFSHGDAAPIGPKRRARPSIVDFPGVLYLAAPGTPIGSPQGDQEPATDWAIGWYPDDWTRWLGLPAFAATTREVIGITVGFGRVRLDLGPDGVVEFSVGNAERFIDALRSTPLAAKLVGAGSLGAGPGAYPPVVFPAPVWPPPGGSPLPDSYYRPPQPFPSLDGPPGRWMLPYSWAGVGTGALAIRLGLGLLAVLLAALAVVAGPDRVPPTAPTVPMPTPTPGRPAGYQGPAYPGMIVQDHVADAAGRTQLLNLAATATNLRPAPANFGGPLACATVDLQNHARDELIFGSFEWTLLSPGGTAQTATIDGTLGAGHLAPGATLAGTVCFDRPAQQGTFVLVWAPGILDVDRGVWLLPLNAS